MATEIERKFLVPDPTLAELGVGRRVRQGYLAIDGDVEVRVRLVDADATLTIKVGRGLTRTEVERTLDPREAEQLWDATADRRVEKVRHLVSLGPDVTAEVDVYEGALAGLCVVEVEHGDLEAARAFDPPDWFGRELTGTPGWSNAELAQRGRPAV